MNDRSSPVAVAFAACGLGAIVLLAYVLTLAPGLLMNDSGEFQTLASTLGHTHPTGYPVYLFSAKPATWLPVKDIAFRVNLFSALCGVVVAIELFFITRILTGRFWLPLVASLALAASPTFWSQAIIAEVYVPAAAYFLGVLLCLLLWQKQGRRLWVFVAGVLGGMSLGVHLSVALCAPAAVVFVAVRREERLQNIAAASLGAFAGVLVTVAAFAVIDLHRPPSNYFRAVVEPSCSEWDLSQEEADRFGTRLAFSLSARQYQENLRQPNLADARRQAAGYLKNLPRELPPLVLLAAGVGLFQIGRRNWQFALLLLLSLATHFAYLLTHNMGDIHVAYIPTYVLLAVCSAALLGVSSNEETGPQDTAKPRWDRWLAALLLASVLFPAFQEDAWTPEGRRAVWVPEGEPPFRVAYSAKLKQDLTAFVKSLEEDAVLFTDWDLLYPLYYVAHVEQERTSMMFVQTYPAMGQRELAESAREFIQRNMPERPVYVLEPLPELSDEFAFEPVRHGGWTIFRLHLRSDAL